MEFRFGKNPSGEPPKSRLQVLKGSVIGKEHVRMKTNNQDGVYAGEAKIGGKDHVFGVICDGCSEGHSNEVGARLLSRFICGEIPMILSNGTPVADAPRALFMRSIGYLRGIAAQTVAGPPDVLVDFVKNYLLCTVMGFLMDPETCVIFSAGDGLIIMDDRIKRIDQHNKPKYIGYHLVDRAYMETQAGQLPQEFETEALRAADINRLAICSDGFEEELTAQLWGHKNALGVQRLLNKLSYFENRFKDDCSVITLERIK